MDDHSCFPYSLLRRRGLIDGADYTPYFFRSIKKRDEIITWLKSGKQNGSNLQERKTVDKDEDSNSGKRKRSNIQEHKRGDK